MNSIALDNIAKNLIYMRQNKGYSQSKVAELLGIGRSAYANWESGRVTPPVDKLDKVLLLYGVTYEAFVRTDMSIKSTVPQENDATIILYNLQQRLEKLEQMVAGADHFYEKGGG